MSRHSRVDMLGTQVPPSEQVREALNRVLLCPEFRSSQRACDFLRYVVEATLNGTADNLKERTIGMDVFGRDSTFEPSDDSSVRVKAGDVRKRLALYYASPRGCTDTILIELPVGSYVPQFHWRAEESGGSSAAERTEDPIVLNHSPHPTPSTHRLRRFGVAAAAAVLIATAAVMVYLHMHPRRLPAPLAQFWAPILESTTPAQILVAPVPLYSLQKPLSLGLPDVKDFHLIPDQYVAVGDLKAEAHIAEFLRAAKGPARIQIGSGVGFEDLRKAPAVLVGFSYNQWKDLNRGMRFTIDPDNDIFFGITENGVPTHWRISLHPDDPKLDEDFAIVSRIFDPDTRQILVQVSGVSHYGTEAAADFITDQELVRQALHDAPYDWPQKNIQIVLHVRVISGAPAAPTIVATHFW